MGGLRSGVMWPAADFAVWPRPDLELGSRLVVVRLRRAGNFQTQQVHVTVASAWIGEGGGDLLIVAKRRQKRLTIGSGRAFGDNSMAGAYCIYID